MSGFRISPAAKLDLDGIWNFIASDNLKAALRILETLEERFSLIAGQPKMGRDCAHLRAGMRCLIVRQYHVFYWLKDDRIEILRVLHSSRDIDSLLE